MHHRRSNERVHLSCVEFDGETSLVIYYYTAMSAWEVAVKDRCFVFNTFSAIRLKSCLTGFVWLTFRSRLWNENCLKSECTRKKGKLILTQEKLLKYAQKREHRRKRRAHQQLYVSKYVSVSDGFLYTSEASGAPIDPMFPNTPEVFPVVFSVFCAVWQLLWLLFNDAYFF